MTSRGGRQRGGSRGDGRERGRAGELGTRACFSLALLEFRQGVGWLAAGLGEGERGPGGPGAGPWSGGCRGESGAMAQGPGHVEEKKEKG
jgi:hypothetical protein